MPAQARGSNRGPGHGSGPGKVAWGEASWRGGLEPGGEDPEGRDRKPSTLGAESCSAAFVRTNLGLSKSPLPTSLIFPGPSPPWQPPQTSR